MTTRAEAIRLADAPERIWLNLCDDPDCGGTFLDHEEVTWHSGRIHEGDIEYVRAERIAALEAENAKLRTVMVAAAEEIHRCWEAHCDAEGYGPANLMHRLEKGIPAEYGYTAGAFEKQRKRIKELEAAAREAREELSASMARLYPYRVSMTEKIDDAIAALDRALGGGA